MVERLVNHVLKERSAKLGKAFDRIEKRLGDTPYFGGETIGVADIAWLPLLHRADVIRRDADREG